MRVVLEGLGKRFGDTWVLRDLDLEVCDSEFVVLLGPSGCGKTTTLRLLAGFEVPDAGRIRIGDRIVSSAIPGERVFVPPERRGIGMVFQSYAIWPHMTVFENVAYPLRVRRVPSADVRRRVESVLEMVGLAEEARRPATRLSGGQMQRVALARALVYNPAVLLLDEPLSNLDLKLREHLRAELKAIQRRTAVTAVYVTHDQTEAAELGDRVAVMHRGRVVQYATPIELWTRPRSRFVADFIGLANVIPGRVEETVGAERVRVALADGVRLTVNSPEGAPPAGAAVYVGIHPEACQLRDEYGSEEDGNEWPVTVEEVRPQGTGVRYVLDLAGRRIEALATGPTMRTPGNRAFLRVPPERIVLIRE